MLVNTWSRSMAFPLSKLSHSDGGNCGMDLLQLSKEVRALLASREKFSSREWVFCSSGDKVDDEPKIKSSGSFHGKESKSRRILFVYSSSSVSDPGECGRLSASTEPADARCPSVAPCPSRGCPVSR